MKAQHLIAVAASAVLLAGVPAKLIAQEPVTNRAGQPPAQPFAENTYFHVSTGSEEIPAGDNNCFIAFGVNLGLPLTSTAGMALGLQVGASIKVCEDDPEYNGTIGVFSRQFFLMDGRSAFALLMDYRRTSDANDLWAFRPIVGVPLGDRDAAGVEFTLGLNSEGGEEAIDQGQIFWVRDWNAAWASQFGLGYQWSRVNETVFRGRLAYRWLENVDVTLGGDVNTNTDYAFGIALSWSFGGTGRHPFVHNIHRGERGYYTPFPNFSFPAMFTGRR